jgi:UDP-N-acetylmuramate dehydrogenase
MQIRENISLKPYNSFGIDAKAKYFASFRNLEELGELQSSQCAIGNAQLILGGGSNILLTKDFD